MRGRFSFMPSPLGRVAEGRVRCGTRLLLLLLCGEFVLRQDLTRPCLASLVGAPSLKGRALVLLQCFMAWHFLTNCKKPDFLFRKNGAQFTNF